MATQKDDSKKDQESQEELTAFYVPSLSKTIYAKSLEEAQEKAKKEDK